MSQIPPALGTVFTFDQAFAFTVGEEGGHSNNPNDKGGDTWYGLSRAAHPNETPWPPTFARVKEIFRAEYWDVCRCDELPPALALALFDEAINFGPFPAILDLQRAIALNQPGGFPQIDGIVGPTTVSRAQRFGNRLARYFLIERLERYEHTESPDQLRSFEDGWLGRVLDVQAEIVRRGWA